MRMRQSLAQFEAAFYEETVEDRRRRERLRREAAQRSYVRRVEKRAKHGNVRFVLLLLAMVSTAIIVTVVMFQTLALFFA